MGKFVQNLKSYLLAAFLTLIPTQLGRHFWPDWSHVLGIRVDYLSPTFYLLDLVWVLIFSLNLKVSIKNFKKIANFKLLICLFFAGLNILISSNKGICVYKWLRLGQIFWTVNYLSLNKNQIKGIISKIIPMWVIGESLLGISQIINGGSLNGIFYFLGERNFNFNTIGIAQMSVAGYGLIRAYGTFSHPNSMAGFLLISILLWFGIKSKVNNKVIWWSVFWFGILGILISGSRLVWTLGFMLWFFNFYFKKPKKQTFGIGVVILGIFILILALINVNYPLNNFLGGWDKASFSKRINLILVSLKMIKENLWLGLGLGNFLNRLPDFQKQTEIFWLQPVHNIGLLLLTEIGVLGVFGLILGLITWFKNKKLNKIEILIFFCILISGMWDHYWLTLPQNLWLLTVVLAII